jgi:hypothetical protein
VWRNKCKDGQKALNDDPEEHRGRPRTSTDENCVIAEGHKHSLTCDESLSDSLLLAEV